MKGREAMRRSIRKNYYRHSLNNPIFGKQYKLKEQHQRQSLKFKIILAGSFILLLACLWFLLFSDFFKIKKINISGQERISAAEIEKISWDQAGKGWWFIKQDNLWLFKRAKLESFLSDTYRLSEIKISKKMFDTLNIKIKERQYAFIWNLDNVYYYTDREGYIIKEVSIPVDSSNTASSSELVSMDASSTRMLAAINPSSASSSPSDLISSSSQPIVLEIPTEVKQDSIIYPIITFTGDKKTDNGLKIQDLIKLDDYMLTSIQRLDEKFQALQDADIILSDFIIKDQFTVEARLKSGLSLYFNPKEDLDKQFNNLLIIKTNKKYDFKKIQPGNYINLKYGDKIFCYPENK